MLTDDDIGEAEPVLDVLIIGAGWAGLGAGRYLHDKGIRNFKILEARNYVGGRSRTVAFRDDDVTYGELG